MDFLSDPELLARMQFALTAGYHFIFVPITIGIGLIMAIFATRAYRSKSPDDEALARMWVNIFTATFVIGVATGITMEFSFGTNWADYSRFVGDIFGAPLAAEALFAFFLESVFLGVLLFGRKKVGRMFYLVSSWLVWVGSCLSALWILIANSWMQTPAGAELSEDGTQAIITDFFAAAFNPTTLIRYSHTVVGLIIMGAFIAIAVAAWYLIKHRHEDSAMKMMRIGSVVGIIATCVMLVTAHSSALVVSEEQPTKLAMMEGMYDSEVPPLYAFGYVDEESQEVVSPLYVPGGTSFLATGTWDTEYPGLNELAETDRYSDIDVESMPVGFVYESYHIMVIMFGLIAVCIILALITTRKKQRIKNKRWHWLQYVLMISPIFPFIAIEAGWMTAEVGRQPYVVYPSTSAPDGVYLLTADGTSASVTSVELLITVVLFIAVYVLLFVGWGRVVSRFIRRGPVYDDNESTPAVENAVGDMVTAVSEGTVSGGSTSHEVTYDDTYEDAFYREELEDDDFEDDDLDDENSEGDGSDDGEPGEKSAEDGEPEDDGSESEGLADDEFEDEESAEVDFIDVSSDDEESEDEEPEEVEEENPEDVEPADDNPEDVEPADGSLEDEDSGGEEPEDDSSDNVDSGSEEPEGDSSDNVDSGGELFDERSMHHGLHEFTDAESSSDNSADSSSDHEDSSADYAYHGRHAAPEPNPSDSGSASAADKPPDSGSAPAADDSSYPDANAEVSDSSSDLDSTDPLKLDFSDALADGDGEDTTGQDYPDPKGGDQA